MKKYLIQAVHKRYYEKYIEAENMDEAENIANDLDFDEFTEDDGGSDFMIYRIRKVKEHDD